MTTPMVNTTSSGIWWVNPTRKKIKKVLDKSRSLCYNKGTKKEEEHKMFNMNQIADAEYEAKMAEVQPEIWVEDWPDDLWDE